VRELWQRPGVGQRTRPVPVFVHLPKTAGSSLRRTLSGQANVHVLFGGVTGSMLEAAKGNLSTFAAVGVTERFGETAELLRRVFGWRGACEERENVTGQRLQRWDLDAGTLARVEERNAMDRELYEHARVLMDGLIAQHGVAGAGAL
jgi:hypothetical protein